MKKLIGIAAGITLLVVSAQAVTNTWIGIGSDNKFSNADNWSEGALATGDVLVFDGFANTSPSNDLGSGFLFSGIVFAQNAASFTVIGNDIHLDHNILVEDLNTASHIISAHIALDKSITVEHNGSGTLEISGDLYNDGFFTEFGIIVDGTGPVTMSGDDNLDGESAYLVNSDVTISGDKSASAGLLRVDSDYTATGSRGSSVDIATSIMNIGDGTGVIETMLFDCQNSQKYVRLRGSSELNIEIGPDTTCDKLITTGALWLDDSPVLNLGGQQIDGVGRTIAISTDQIIGGTFKDTPNNSIVQGTGTTLDPYYYIHYNLQDDDGRYHITIDKEQTPTSSAIDLRAFETAEGVMVEFTAYDVEADGTILLQLMDESDAVVWSDSVDVVEGPEFTASFMVPGLVSGNSYNFRLRDEVGNWWDAKNITVGSFNVEAASKMIADVTLSFDSLPEREYDIQWSAELGNEWQTLDTVTATAEKTTVVLSSSEETIVVVDAPEGSEDSGFFRIQAK